MANQDKNPGTSRRRTRTGTSGRKVNSRTIRARHLHRMPARQYELIMFVIMGLAVLLGIAIYFGNKAILLSGIRYFSFGAFGVTAYLLPVVIFVAALFKMANQGNHRLDDKVKLASLILLNISIIAHIFYVTQPQLHLKINNTRMFAQVLANYYRVSGNYHVSGGFLGGLFGDLLLIPLGKWGTFVLTIVLFVVFIILFTEATITQVIGFLQVFFANIYNWIKKKIIQLQERNAQQEQPEQFGEQTTVESNLINQRSAESEIQQPKKRRRIPFLNIDLTMKDHSENKEDKKQVETVTSAEPSVNNFKTSQGISDAENAMASSEQNVSEKDRAKETVSSDKTATKPNKAEILEEQKAIQEEMKLDQDLKTYSFPPIELLKEPVNNIKNQNKIIENNAHKLEETLQSFGVSAKVINVSQGPTVTRYEIQPAQGVKVSRIVGLSDDIALNLAAAGIRMEAPIPGKSAIGIEVPNREAGSVMLREVVDSPEFKKSATKLSFGLGKDITGRALVTDIAKMPHLLIAGATGSGKSVCINTLIVSLLYKAKPEEVRLLMIDPKVVELSVYNGIPHLLIPVVTDPKKAAGALNWAVQEMNDRYKLFAATGVRDLKGYNKIIEEKGETPKLPQIVIIVDELADLMMAASNEVEDAICRLAQMARAAGLHLIIATQRPSVDVITGLIKANIPSRIAFNVSSGTDSRTIIDMNGAEKLLGKGDMLFYPVGYPKPVRIQGAFISDHEVENIVDYLKTQQQTEYNQKIMNHLNKTEETSTGEVKDDLDEFFADALELVVDKERASASMIQRQFRVGFNRAARIVDQLAEAGYVGEEQGSKAREVLITRRELEQLKAKAKQGADAMDNETGNQNLQSHDNSSVTEISNAEAEDIPVNDAINDLVDEINERK